MQKWGKLVAYIPAHVDGAAFALFFLKFTINGAISPAGRDIAQRSEKELLSSAH